MTLRTLHLTNAWHESSGGIATFYRALLAAANPDWRVDLIVPGRSAGTDQISPFATIHRVQARSAPFDASYRLLYPSSYLTATSPVQRIVRSVQPHVVETTDKYSLVYLAGLIRAGWMRGLLHRPALVGLSCERMDDNLQAYTPFHASAATFAQAYMRFIYFCQFDHHIAVSARTAQELQLASEGHKRSRGIWIRGMGVDLGVFNPLRRQAKVRQELLRKSQAPEDAALLLYAGRLAPEKNLELLSDTLRHLPDVELRLLIAGDGPNRDSLLLEMTARFGSRVVYLGHQSNRDHFADLLANVDVFVHPNPREPFGIAPLEAMASGTPLVCPDRGGVTEYANSGNAWLCQPSGDCFAAAVLSAIQNPILRVQRSAEGLRTAAKYSWPLVARQFHALYLDLYARTQGTLAPAPQEPDFWSRPIGAIDTAL